MLPAAAGLRLFSVLPIAACVALLTVSGLAPAAIEQGAVPIAVAGLLIGVPHGAVDHLVPRWVGIPESVVPLGALLGAYVGVAVLAGSTLVLLPTAALVGFLLLSALHFGSAETSFVAERRGGRTARPWQDPLASVTHGAVVVGLLLWAHPAAVDPALRLLDPGTARIVTAARVPGLCVVGGLVLAQLAALLVRGRSGAPRAGLLPAGELVLLVAAFSVAPLAAFGVYFGCWHAVRHTGRLLDAARTPADAGWSPAARRLAVSSILPSLAALVTIGLLATVWATAVHGPLLVEVAVLLALTFPHTATVWAVDLWRTRSRGSPHGSAEGRLSVRGGQGSSSAHRGRWTRRSA